MIFSIIIPSFNSSKYISETLESISDQDFKDYECIVIDDFSTDDTLKVVESFTKKDKRFRVIKNNTNQGPSASRNSGIKAAKGEYIVFIDSDDIADRSLLSSLNAQIKTNRIIDILHWDYGTIDKDGVVKNASWVSASSWPKHIFNLKDMEVGKAFSQINYEIWSKAFRTDFIKDNKIRFSEDIRRAEDMLFFLEAFIKSSTNIYVNESLIYYRTDSDNSLMKNYNSIDEIVSLKKLRELLKSLNLYGKYELAFMSLSLSVLSYFAQHSYDSNKFPVIYKGIVSFLEENKVLDYHMGAVLEYVRAHRDELRYLIRVGREKYIYDKQNNIKYGIFTYEFPGYNLQHGHNIGDDIQSVAASRFLPKIDYFINRDDIDGSLAGVTECTVRLIMNGWYMLGVNGWPPKSRVLKPLITSLHINPTPWQKPTAYDAFSSDDSVNFLKNNGPIGARDKRTKEILDDLGVETYFSGCLTLTLNKDASIPKRDFILTANISDEAYSIIKSRTKLEVIKIDTLRTRHLSYDEKHAVSKYYLYLYQSAKAVVATRLHATLPSLALGTPVLYIVDDEVDDRPDFKERFRGLYDLVNHTSVSELRNRTYEYDFDNPPENPKKYLKVRKDLEKISYEYTGYKGDHSFLDGQSVEDFLNDPSLISGLCKSMNRSLVADDTDMLYEEIDTLKSNQKELEKKILDYQGSTSWKITQPIRLLGRAIRRVSSRG